MKPSFYGFDDVLNHTRMLVDRERIEAYARAIAETVRPGDVVADIGTGSGVLAILALRAGARKVYAVERGGVAELAARIFRDNDPLGRIEILRSDARDVRFSEPPSVLVSETLGAFGIDEDISQLYRVLLPRCAPDVRLIPQRVRIVLAPYADRGLTLDRELLAGFPGVNLDALVERTGNRPVLARLSAADELGAATTIAEFELRTSPLPDRFVVEIPIAREGRLNLLGGWFEADLTDTVSLTNSPHGPVTSWHQHCFPVEPAVPVSGGDRLRVELEPRISGASALWRWTISTGSTVRVGDVLRSSGGDLRDFALQLGIGLATGVERVPSLDLEMWAAMLGGSTDASIEEMTARLLAAHPDRFADPADARDEVLRRLSLADSLR